MPLTNAQRKAYAAAARKERAALFALHQAKKAANPSRRKGNGRRSNATNVLAQGVGALPRKNFGSGPVGSDLRVWDAKMPLHLPLPRSVGSYTVVRTTRNIKTPATSMLFGTFKFPNDHVGLAGEWSNICAIGSVVPSLLMNAGSNATRWRTPLEFSGTAGTCTPSAFSVQIMNPEALQTTTGIIYAGCMDTQARIEDRAESWNDYWDRFVSFQNPRLLAAAKLALRGVCVNAYPLNMNALADFTKLYDGSDGSYTNGATEMSPQGFCPILVSNPDAVQLEYLVTTEWRVRFDLTNPASAGHVHHPISSDFTWNKLMTRAIALGNGVMDIADVVANAGQVIERARPLLQMADRTPMLRLT